MNYFWYDADMDYPTSAPYHPDYCYPEYPFDPSYVLNNTPNGVYAALRQMFIDMGLDKDHINTKEWNPLGEYITPGQTVLLKPNLVKDFNSAEAEYNRGVDCLITHPSLTRCLFDYTYIALGGKGKIIVADAPIQGCDFAKLLEKTGYKELFDFIEAQSTESLGIVSADLREVIYYKDGEKTIQKEREMPEYYGIVVDLGKDSYFDEVEDKKRLRITSYDGKDTVSQHDENRNIYKISSALLQADVVLSISKPKTHRIAGYTAALKNMIGINARKEYLPHHSIGSKEHGGDEYHGAHQLLKWINSKSNDLRNHEIKNNRNCTAKLFNSIGRKTGRKLDHYEPDRHKFGMWYGNDTIWRTILDVNHGVIYADKKGKIQNDEQRKIIYVGDMIVSGDHEGPLSPNYKKIGGLLFSENPVEFDLIVVKLMGFDYHKFPVLRNAVKDEKLIDLDDVSKVMVRSNSAKFNKSLEEVEENFEFVPASGWISFLKP